MGLIVGAKTGVRADSHAPYGQSPLNGNGASSGRRVPQGRRKNGRRFLSGELAALAIVNPARPPAT